MKHATLENQIVSLISSSVALRQDAHLSFCLPSLSSDSVTIFLAGFLVSLLVNEVVRRCEKLPPFLPHLNQTMCFSAFRVCLQGK